MKYYSLIFCLLFLSNTLFAQNQELKCGTPPPTKEQYEHTRDVVANIAIPRNSGMTSIPIKVFMTRKSDGTGGFSDLKGLNQALATLNHRFKDAGFEFFFTKSSIEYIDDDWYFNNYFGPLGLEGVFMKNYHDFSAINVVFAGIRTYVNNTTTNGRSKRLVVMANKNNSLIDFIHEMGHLFGLLHTFTSTADGNDLYVGGQLRVLRRIV